MALFAAAPAILVVARLTVALFAAAPAVLVVAPLPMAEPAVIAPAPVRVIMPAAVFAAATVVPTVTAGDFIHFAPPLSGRVVDAVHDLFNYALGDVEELVDYPTHSSGSLHRNFLLSDVVEGIGF
ncbi:hypothetical protein [Streptomyces sp. ISL-11]|uniref:hypothetical protein n=1 Tax=Streptomyces sp. ISL-11 TaxID=2819174 RepID=UPI001BE8D768|nr:hypothetical protein [Streptomyces sp. ISL-11]MBT2384964.1 hypothetical protein [Streptomyces sp. ISL-11]